MPWQDIRYEESAGIATITLNRPERLNAFRSRTIEELTATLALASKDKKIGVIVLAGAGGKAFSVGGDIEEMKGLDHKGGQAFVNRLARLAKAFLECPKPIVAKVNGYCLGGGHEIHLFCDLTVASEKSVFGQVGPRVGSAPLWGGTQIIPLLTGLKKAKEIIFLCRQYSASEALRMGLVNEVVGQEKLDATVEGICRELLGMSPQSLKLARASLNAGIWSRIQHDLKEGLTGIYGSAELAEGMGAFLEKRRPDFQKFRQ